MALAMALALALALAMVMALAMAMAKEICPVGNRPGSNPGPGIKEKIA